MTPDEQEMVFSFAQSTFFNTVNLIVTITGYGAWISWGGEQHKYILQTLNLRSICFGNDHCRCISQVCKPKYKSFESQYLDTILSFPSSHGTGEEPGDGHRLSYSFVCSWYFLASPGTSSTLEDLTSPISGIRLCKPYQGAWWLKLKHPIGKRWRGSICHRGLQRSMSVPFTNLIVLRAIQSWENGNSIASLERLHRCLESVDIIPRRKILEDLSSGSHDSQHRCVAGTCET